jgi:hypothetical protein
MNRYINAYEPQPERQVQRIETRPTFDGRVGVGRLLVFVALGAVLVLACFFWVGLDKMPSLLLGMAFVMLAWTVDLYFATGLGHKQTEQQTERLRIRAALADAMALDETRDQQLDILRSEIQRLELRLDSMESLRLWERGEVKVINKTDDLGLKLKNWMVQSIFDVDGRLVGVHPNGQLVRAMPFKEQGEDNGAGYRRLAACGLVAKRDNNYVWVGPNILPLALEKLNNSGRVE